MDKGKISIIVPIYNVEDYLEDCVKSIVNQTYKNLEIILVDDGSTDNSGKIADEFVKKDNRVKVLHKENGGLSDARNAGMDAATGEYLMFVDSDDFLLPTACEVLINKIFIENADYVIANYTNCNDAGVLWNKPVFDTKKYMAFKLDIKDYKASFYIMNSAVWNKLFRTSFVKGLNIKFRIGLPAEDAIFTTYCFLKSTKVYYIPDVVYAYRQREQGTSISTSCTVEYFNGINKAYRIIYEHFKENNELGFYRFFYAKSLTYMLYKFIDSTLLTEEEKVQVLSDMTWFYNLSEELNVPACQESLGLIINKIIAGSYKESIEICKVIAEVRAFMPNEIKEKMSKPQADLYTKMMTDSNNY